MLAMHVGGLKQRAGEHHLPVQRDRRAFQRHPSKVAGSSIEANRPCGAYTSMSCRSCCSIWLRLATNSTRSTSMRFSSSTNGFDWSGWTSRLLLLPRSARSDPHHHPRERRGVQTAVPPGSNRGQRQSGSFSVAQAVQLTASDAFVQDAVLGVATRPCNGACIKHLVAGIEKRHGVTHRFDQADGIPAEDAGFLCCRPGAHFHVHGIHRDGTHLDPQVAGAGRGSGTFCSCSDCGSSIGKPCCA